MTEASAIATTRLPFGFAKRFGVVVEHGEPMILHCRAGISA
ncbi:hypothetical protein, partial [Idiomarina abyssalis]